MNNYQRKGYESYRVLMLCSSLISDEDLSILSRISDTSHMIFKRDTGYLVKLYEEDPISDAHGMVSSSLIQIMEESHRSGFRMIEFDCDAPNENVPVNVID